MIPDVMVAKWMMMNVVAEEEEVDRVHHGELIVEEMNETIGATEIEIEKIEIGIEAIEADDTEVEVGKTKGETEERMTIEKKGDFF